MLSSAVAWIKRGPPKRTSIAALLLLAGLIYPSAAPLAPRSRDVVRRVIRRVEWIGYES